MNRKKQNNDEMRGGTVASFFLCQAHPLQLPHEMRFWKSVSAYECDVILLTMLVVVWMFKFPLSLFQSLKGRRVQRATTQGTAASAP